MFYHMTPPTTPKYYMYTLFTGSIELRKIIEI